MGPAEERGRCPECGVVFDIEVDLTAVPPLVEIRRRRETTIWRWRELLPTGSLKECSPCP